MTNLFQGFNQTKTVQRTKGEGGGGISIVNTEGFGKRITLAKGMLEKIGNPKFVSVGLSAEAIAIAPKLPENTSRYKISRHTIYASGLIDEIVKHFDLDYSDRTSISFSKIDFIEVDKDTVAAIVKIK